MSEKYYNVLMSDYNKPEQGRLGLSVEVWADIIHHGAQSDADIMAILSERDKLQSQLDEARKENNRYKLALINIRDGNYDNAHDDYKARGLARSALNGGK